MKARTHRTGATRVVAAAAIPLLLFATAGCGGTKDGHRSDGPSSSPETFEEYRLNLTACMREEGVDVPDASDGGVSLGGIDMEAFQAAFEKCRAKLGEPPAQDRGDLTQSQQQQHEKYLEIAACMRDNGVDVADPPLGSPIDVPPDVPTDVFDKCAPEGISGAAG